MKIRATALAAIPLTLWWSMIRLRSSRRSTSRRHVPRFSKFFQLFSLSNSSFYTKYFVSETQSLSFLTPSHGKAFIITGPLCGESIFDRRIPQMPAIGSVHAFFIGSVNKLPNKQSRCRWFETPWHWCDVTVILTCCHIIRKCFHSRYLLSNI